MAVAFSEMIARLSADERKLLDNTFSKYPELKEDWVNAKEDGLRQADYSREMNKLKSQETEFQKAKERAQELEDWADRNVPIWDALAEKGIVDKETGEELWTKQKTALEQQLEEANRKIVAGGTDMDPAELEKRVKDIVAQAGGGLTKTEVAALIDSEAKKMVTEGFTEQWKAKETDFNTKTIPFVSGFAASVAVLASQFEKETGEPWTEEKHAELMQVMSREQVFDALKLKDKILAPYVEKKKGTELTAAQQRIKDLEAQLAGRSVPGGGGDSETYIPQPGEPKGALREMLERSGESSDFEALIRSKAAEAGKALVTEGKS